MSRKRACRDCTSIWDIALASQVNVAKKRPSLVESDGLWSISFRLEIDLKSEFRLARGAQRVHPGTDAHAVHKMPTVICAVDTAGAAA